MPNNETRLYRLEALAAIQDLRARYAAAADGKYFPGGGRQPAHVVDACARIQAECFTEDGIYDADLAGRTPTIGREALFERFRAGSWDRTTHMFLNPRIEVFQDRAEARWQQLQILQACGTGHVFLRSAECHDRCVCIEGHWLIAHYRSHQRFLIRMPNGAELA